MNPLTLEIEIGLRRIRVQGRVRNSHGIAFLYAFPHHKFVHAERRGRLIPAVLRVIVFPLWSHTIGRRLTFLRCRSRWVS
jgi:hypothetical protein